MTEVLPCVLIKHWRRDREDKYGEVVLAWVKSWILQYTSLSFSISLFIY